MGSRLVLRVVASMFCRLRMRESPNRKNTEHKRNGKKSAESVVHRSLVSERPRRIERKY